MALFGDWNGDGKNDRTDDFIEYMILSNAWNEERGQKKSSGGCCLFSFIFILSPVIGAFWLIGSLIA